MEPVWSPVVVVLPHRRPQQVRDEIHECWPVQRPQLPVHGGEVGVVLRSSPVRGHVENVSGVHLVHPVTLAACLELVYEGRHKPLEGMADKQERERRTFEQFSDVVSLWPEPLGRCVKILFSDSDVRNIKEDFIPGC